MSPTRRRIAVLGAGIMGSSTALFLARRGVAVTLFDGAPQPFSAASRWNEGKIHLGFLYNADPTLRTARWLLPGGLMFKPLTEELIGCTLQPAMTADNDIYLCHANSVVPPQAMHDYFLQVAELLRQHPDASRYLVSAADAQVTRLTTSELGAITTSADIVAGFSVPERSVSTTWVADRFVDALAAEPSIEPCMATHISAVRPQSSGDAPTSWYVESSRGVHGPYDGVVNALWQGRLAIDITAGLQPTGIWSHRFRRSLFLRTTQPVDLPSLMIATGPFGDIKNYNGRDFYLSWYPAGLMAESTAVLPDALEPPDAADRQQRSQAVLQKLGQFLPALSRLAGRIERMTLEGGWVYAAGQGALSDPASSLHRRNEFGIVRLGSYISVDTGKYSTAPWMARKIADSVMLNAEIA